MTDEHGLRRRDVQDPAEPRAGRDGPELERAAARREPALAHVVAERGDRHPLRDLRLGDERAGAAAAGQMALADEVVERRADGQPRDAEVDAEQALGRDRVADVERLDQLEHLLARLALLRHRSPLSSAGVPAGDGLRQQPRRRSADRRTGGAPGRPRARACRRRVAAVRASTRAVKRAPPSAIRPRVAGRLVGRPPRAPRP